MDGITTTEHIKDDASASNSTGTRGAGVSAPSYTCGQPAAVEAKVRAIFCIQVAWFSNFAISMMITFAAMFEVLDFFLTDICSK